MLWLDGAYAWQPGVEVEWCGHRGMRDEDVAQPVGRIRDRVMRKLRKIRKASSSIAAQQPRSQVHSAAKRGQ